MREAREDIQHRSRQAHLAHNHIFLCTYLCEAKGLYYQEKLPVYANAIQMSNRIAGFLKEIALYSQTITNCGNPSCTRLHIFCYKLVCYNSQKIFLIFTVRNVQYVIFIPSTLFFKAQLERTFFLICLHTIQPIIFILLKDWNPHFEFKKNH